MAGSVGIFLCAFPLAGAVEPAQARSGGLALDSEAKHRKHSLKQAPAP